MRLLFFICCIALSLVALPGSQGDASAQDAVTVHFFSRAGCPFCSKAEQALQELAAKQNITVRKLTVGKNATTDRLFATTLEHFGHQQAAVPLVVIGDRSFLGFAEGGHSRDLYRRAIATCAANGCDNVVARLEPHSENVGVAGADSRPTPTAGATIPDTINLPIVGSVNTGDLSLTALTVLMAAVDGFNPCAMWVLVFLIGILLGLEDRRRMWILGGSFLLATGVMYFAVLAAWLNLILLLGVVVWVRIAVGLLAVGGGLFFLREYWTKPEAVCRVTDHTRRSRIMDRIRFHVLENRLPLSVIGIMGVAVAVNFIELICSAGVPAVYTQVLALSDLTAARYYSYLLLYIAVFMLDDLAIFATAMVALQVSGLTGRYAQFSHLIGGVVLLSIGALLLLRPDLLAFSQL